MPKLLRARAPQDTAEEQKVRKLANSRHAPGDWIMRARMIARSWDGLRTTEIAQELGCHPQTVRERLHRFNDEGLDGLGDRPGAGRKRRITETERSLIISLVGTDPPGKLVRGAGGELEASDEEREAHWTVRRPHHRCPRARDHHRTKPGAPHLARRRSEVAKSTPLGREQ